MTRWLFLSLASLAVLAASCWPAPAQCFNSGYHYGYNTGYTYTNYQYQAPTVQYVDRFVPLAIGLPFQAIIPVSGYTYTGSVSAVPLGAYPQQPAMQQTNQAAAQPSACDVKLNALKNEFKAELDALKSQLKANVPAEPSGSGGPPRAKKGTDVSSLAYSILRTNCASCHTGNKAKGGVQIFLPGDHLNPAVDRRKLVNAADEGRMPPDAQRNTDAALSDEDVEVLRKWAS